MSSKRKGEEVAISIKRNDQILRFNITPKTVKIRPVVVKLTSLVEEGKKVPLAVVVSDVKNATGTASDAVYASWADSIRNNIQANIEQNLLSMFANDNNFMIVDRSRLMAILDEFKFSQLGFVSDNLRTKIGEMTGAKYLIDANFSRFSEGNNLVDVEIMRLIEIETGAVLAVDRTKKFKSRL